MITALQHPVMATFGELLKQKRKGLMLTQEELAAKAGVSGSTVRNYERMKLLGDRRPYELRQVIETLGLKIEDLAGDNSGLHGNGRANHPAAPEEEMRREVEGFARLLKGEGLRQLWSEGRQLCQSQLARASPKSKAG